MAALKEQPGHRSVAHSFLSTLRAPALKTLHLHLRAPVSLPVLLPQAASFPSLQKLSVSDVQLAEQPTLGCFPRASHKLPSLRSLYVGSSCVMSSLSVMSALASGAAVSITRIQLCSKEQSFDTCPIAWRLFFSSIGKCCNLMELSLSCLETAHTAASARLSASSLFSDFSSALANALLPLTKLTRLPLTKLTRLLLTKLTRLPLTKLTRLHLLPDYGNRVVLHGKVVSAAIAALTALRSLELGCDCREYPPELTIKEPQRVFDAFAKLQQVIYLELAFEGVTVARLYGLLPSITSLRTLVLWNGAVGEDEWQPLEDRFPKIRFDFD